MKIKISLLFIGMILFCTNLDSNFNSLCMNEAFNSCNIFEYAFAQSNSNDEWIISDGNKIEINSKPSSTFSSFEQQFFDDSNSNFVAGLVLLTAIFSFLLGSHLILKRRRVSSRPYLLLIIAGILLFFGLPNLVASVLSLSVNLLFQTNLEASILVGLIVSSGFALMLVVIAGIILIKSKLIRQGLGYGQK